MSISYSRRDVRKSPEARVGPVSSSERLVSWMYALLANASTVVAPAVPRRTNTKVRIYTDVRSRILHKKVVLFPPPRSVPWRAAYYVGLLARSPVATERSRSEHTAVQPCVSNWYSICISNSIEFLLRGSGLSFSTSVMRRNSNNQERFV